MSNDSIIDRLFGSSFSSKKEKPYEQETLLDMFYSKFSNEYAEYVIKRKEVADAKKKDIEDRINAAEYADSLFNLSNEEYRATSLVSEFIHTELSAKYGYTYPTRLGNIRTPVIGMNGYAFIFNNVNNIICFKTREFAESFKTITGLEYTIVNNEITTITIANVSGTSFISNPVMIDPKVAELQDSVLKPKEAISELKAKHTERCFIGMHGF